jgi:DNA-binding FrmR family transcriptional regulator
MVIELGATDDVIKRLRRIEGQVGGIIRMLEEQRDCEDVITQLAAASRALDRTGFKLLSAGMRQCMSSAATGEAEPMSPEQMENASRAAFTEAALSALARRRLPAHADRLQAGAPRRDPPSRAGRARGHQSVEGQPT